MVTLPHSDTLIMVGAYSGRENTLTVVDVDPRFIAEIDPYPRYFAAHGRHTFCIEIPPAGLLFCPIDKNVY